MKRTASSTEPSWAWLVLFAILGGVCLVAQVDAVDGSMSNMRLIVTLGVAGGGLWGLFGEYPAQ